MKTITRPIAGVLLLFAASPVLKPLATPQPAAESADNSALAVTHFVGEHFGGGIVLC